MSQQYKPFQDVGLLILRSLGTTLIFITTALPASPALLAQTTETTQQAYPLPTLRVTTRIVVLDVVVTDTTGRLSNRLLTKDDFTVYEDGIQQTVRSFETPADHQIPMAPGGAPLVVKTAADLKKIGDAPVTLLVLDELNSRFEDMSFSRQMMLKYLQAQPPVLKQPTVLMIAMNKSFQQVHDYTQDRDALIEAIRKHIPEYPWKVMNGGSGPTAVERMAQVLAALQQIAQASGGTAGRKNLIWVGNGFPSANLVGLPVDEGKSIETAIRRCTVRLLDARITMYTINPVANSTVTVDMDDAGDLDQTATDAGPDPFSGQATFAALAPATGGIAFSGRNDLNNVIGEGIGKGESYYTLSYAPTGASGAATKYRNIRIVMKDKGLHATTRNGYFPETGGDLNAVLDKTMPLKQVTANLRLDISSALTTSMSYNGLSVTAEKSPDGLYTVKVMAPGIGWSEPGSDLSEHAEATVAAAWYDAKGKILGHAAKELVAMRQTGNTGATFQIPLTLTGNPVRLRIVVRDAMNGKMGTVDLTKF